MKPGRELDALIAEKVIGLERVRYQEQGYYNDLVYGDNLMAGVASQVPYYSTDIAAAWEIVEKLIADGRHINIAFYQKMGPNRDGPPYEAHWSVTGFYNWQLGKADANSAPHAICLAALKAVGHEFK